MPERKLVIHLEKIGFDRRIGEMGEMLATHENDKKEGGDIKLRAALLEFLTSQSRPLDFH